MKLVSVCTGTKCEPEVRRFPSCVVSESSQGSNTFVGLIRCFQQCHIWPSNCFYSLGLFGSSWLQVVLVEKSYMDTPFPIPCCSNLAGGSWLQGPSIFLILLGSILLYLTKPSGSGYLQSLSSVAGFCVNGQIRIIFLTRTTVSPIVSLNRVGFCCCRRLNFVSAG